MKEAEHGEECEDEGEGEPRAGEEAEHGEECADEGEGEVEDGKDWSPNEACRWNRLEILKMGSFYSSNSAELDFIFAEIVKHKILL